jgi:hypothetical protein
MDSWSRFDYHPAFGLIVGMFYHDDAIYLRVDREAWVQDGVTWRGANGAYGFDVLERQSLLPKVSDMPYLDSIRRGDTLWTAPWPGTDFYGQEYPFLACAFARGRVDGANPATANPHWLQGAMPAPNTLEKFNSEFYDIPEGAAKRDLNYYVLGLPFDSFVELTSPVRRDANGQPIMQGRLTINKLEVHYKDASGFVAVVNSTYDGPQQTYNFEGSLLSQPVNIIGAVPVTSGTGSVFIGREVKDYTCSLKARSWCPLSITRVTWTGQWFLNHRFV